MGANAIYRCCEPGCYQVFQNLESFKKYLNRKHICQDDDILITTFDTDIAKGSVNLCNSSQRTTLANDLVESLTSDEFEESKDTHSHLSIVDLVKNCKKFVAEFILVLHNNDNFSRKDVFEIQNNIKSKLIIPMLDTIMQFINSKYPKWPYYARPLGFRLVTFGKLF